jgi:hypothetical protein
MTQPPDGQQVPEPAIEMRSRPSDVVADPPVVKSPAPESSVPTSASGARPGTAPADTAVLATQRAARVADVAAGAAEPRVMTTDSIMPTCMIYSMFAVLFLLLFPLGYWMVTMIVTGAAFR